MWAAGGASGPAPTPGSKLIGIQVSSSSGTSLFCLSSLYQRGMFIVAFPFGCLSLWPNNLLSVFVKSCVFSRPARSRGSRSRSLTVCALRCVRSLSDILSTFSRVFQVVWCARLRRACDATLGLQYTCGETADAWTDVTGDAQATRQNACAADTTTSPPPLVSRGAFVRRDSVADTGEPRTSLRLHDRSAHNLARAVTCSSRGG